MEIRIGIRENGRDLSFESEKSTKEIADLVRKGLESGVLEVEDNKGRHYLIPASALAYVEMGVEDKRRVGFIA